MQSYLKLILIIYSFLQISSSYSQESIKLKDGTEIDVSRSPIEYKSNERLYFIKGPEMYYINRSEFDYAMNYWYVDTGKQLVKQNWSEVEAQKEVTETDYFQLNRKGSSNITTGILMVFVVPAALGYGWLYLAPEMTELLYAGSLSTLIGIIQWSTGVKQKRIAAELANAKHYE